MNKLRSYVVAFFGSVVCLSGLWCCSPAPESFSFIVTSDTHYAKEHQYEQDAEEKSPGTAATWKSSERTFEPFLQTLKKQVQEITPKPVFWLSTGDLVNGGDFGAGYEEPIAAANMEMAYKDLIADLGNADIGVPLINAKGNNEGKGRKALLAYEEVFLPHMSNGLGRAIESTYFSFDYSNAHFVILDEFTTELFDRDKQLPFDLGNEQLEWLEADLKASRDADHIFVFHHTPVIPPIPGNHIHLNNPQNRERYVDLLLENNVRIVFVGHNHSLGLLEYEKGDRSFVQIMSNSRNLERSDPTYIRTAYDPDDLKGNQESERGRSIYEIAQHFAPNVKRHFFARHFPGHLVVTVEGNKLTIKAFLGTTQDKYKEWMISKDPESGKSLVEEF